MKKMDRTKTRTNVPGGGVLLDDLKSNFTTSADHNSERTSQLKPFMRIVLDEMPNDPDPVERRSQGTVVDADAYQVVVSWDEQVGRSLHLIPGVDKYHILDTSDD